MLCCSCKDKERALGQSYCNECLGEKAHQRRLRKKKAQEYEQEIAEIYGYLMEKDQEKVWEAVRRWWFRAVEKP